MFTLTTLFVLAGAAASSIGIAYVSGKKGDHSDGKVANNPYSEWDFNQPYNPS